MVKSMTGYGTANYKDEELAINVEMKSVNHRYLDISIRMPQSFLKYENEIKKLIQAKIKRGKVDVFILLESDALFEKRVQVNDSLLKSYLETFQHVKELHNITGSLSIEYLLQFPDIFSIIEIEHELPKLKETLMGTCERAVEHLVAMREKEGEVLGKKISEGLENIVHRLAHIKARSEEMEPIFQKRLFDKLNTLLQDEMEIDEARILTEVAIQVERTDIQEEITRLKSHCEQFRSTLKTEATIGRKLDFLVQEMNREINTIGSKSNDLTINQEVVNVKTTLEMIREQIQNIE